MFQFINKINCILSSVQKVRFNNSKDREFSKVVKKRVAQYFEDNNLSRNANTAMYIKTVLMLTLYIGSYALIISGQFSLAFMWFCTFLLGVGMAGVGFCISHDAMHGAYSSNKYVNKALGYTFDMMGANSYIWNIMHNIVHHTYTNIEGHDEDIDVADFIRLSPHAEVKKIHRVQHIVAFLAYSLTSFFWVFVKDYKKFLQSNIGAYRNKTHPVSEWIILFVTKGLYYFYMIALPLLLLDITFLQFVIGFMTFHLTAGLILGLVFQLAHVVEGTAYPLPDDEHKMPEHWLIHEMITTNNFGRSSKPLSWFLGGLNFQIEHHLFPRTCSVHYPEISHIVEETACEFNIPYNQHETFTKALISHYRMLKNLGDPDYTFPNPSLNRASS